MNPGIQSSEILINASAVTQQWSDKVYEFVLNLDLEVIECVQIESLTDGIAFPVSNYLTKLNKDLFELNHVRVNPHIDNQDIIMNLTTALDDIGVNIHNQPSQDSMELCFRPLGEISCPVRFYFDLDGKLVFLSSARHLKVVNNN